jgi:hypothetical protein
MPRYARLRGRRTRANRSAPVACQSRMALSISMALLALTLFVVGEVPSRSEWDRVLNTGLGDLTTPLNIPLRKDCDNSSTSGDRVGDIDDSSSVNPRSDGLTSEKQVGKQCFISTLPTSVAGSEAGYDPWEPHSQILILTDGAYLDIPSSTRRQKTLSLIILLHSLTSSSG